MDLPPSDSREKFEKALEEQQKAKYMLRLYISGNTTKSQRAIHSIQEFCETRLKGRYELEVIDVSQKPELIRDQQLIAMPTLIKELPQPLRRMVGDLSQIDQVLLGLDLHSAEEGAGTGNE